MILKAVLKKPWRSHKGKLYPIGTTFVLEERYLQSKSALYRFDIPGECYGLTVIPDKIFLQLTPEEKALKLRRKKAYEDHVKKWKDRFIGITS